MIFVKNSKKEVICAYVISIYRVPALLLYVECLLYYNLPSLTAYSFFTVYPFGPDGQPTPGVFNGFRSPLPTVLDPTRPSPPSLIGGKP